MMVDQQENKTNTTRVLSNLLLLAAVQRQVVPTKVIWNMDGMSKYCWSATVEIVFSYC